MSRTQILKKWYLIEEPIEIQRISSTKITESAIFDQTNLNYSGLQAKAKTKLINTIRSSCKPNEDESGLFNLCVRKLKYYVISLYFIYI